MNTQNLLQVNFYLNPSKQALSPQVHIDPFKYPCPSYASKGRMQKAYFLKTCFLNICKVLSGRHLPLVS